MIGCRVLSQARAVPFSFVSPLWTGLGLVLALIAIGCAGGSSREADGGDVLPSPAERPPTADTSPDLRSPAPPQLPSPTGTSVFVHLFEWPWPDVARECETFLGPHGFAGVQISPPSEHTVRPEVGHPWWQRYQTVSYRLDQSRSGTRAEFIDMIERCGRAGVAIYADAVINHMTALPTGVGSAGTTFEKYRYPGLFEPVDFHMPPCGIAPSDYAENAVVVQRCELDGLADLDTASSSVREKLAAYLRALVSLGVRGFRIDAAKHIPPADLDAVLARAVASTAPGTTAPPFSPYLFLEVIDYGGEAVRAADYLGVGRTAGLTVDVTEFKYAGGIGAHFLGRSGQTLAQLRTLSPTAWNLLPSDRALVFSNNHDTQRQDGLSYRHGATHDLANVFLLAWPYGRIVIASSYVFDHTTQDGRDAGPRSDLTGNTLRGQSCASAEAALAPGGWVCEHRRPTVHGMVKFRQVAGDAVVSNWWDNGRNQIAFGRARRAFVVINNENAVLVRRFAVDLEPGRYCEVSRGVTATAGSCRDVMTVEANGEAFIEVPPRAASAYHVEARP
jgi:alpha-amylase